MDQGNFVRNVKKMIDVKDIFREVFMEKHWKTVVNKTICDYFFEAQKKVRHLLSFPSSIIRNLFSVPIQKMFHLFWQLLIII